MKLEIKGLPSFGYADLILEPGEHFITESGSMATMDAALDLNPTPRGGILSSIIRKVFLGESFFMNEYRNVVDRPLRLTLTQKTPGYMVLRELRDEVIYLQPGAFIACDPTIQFSTEWAGISSFIGKEGLFRLVAYGTGRIIFGGYGEVLEKDVNGELIVDTGHLIAYQRGISLKAQLSGGIISSFTSGEGLVTRVQGSGKVWIQTRSLQGLASWINRYF